MRTDPIGTSMTRPRLAWAFADAPVDGIGPYTPNSPKGWRRASRLFSPSPADSVCKTMGTTYLIPQKSPKKEGKYTTPSQRA